MWEQLRQFRALERPVRRIFLVAAAVLPFISLSLRLRGFLKTRTFLQNHLSSSHDPNQLYSICPKVTARMVRAAARYGLGHPTCLQESLALWWLLGRQGIPSDLRVGVRKHADKFEAHAWVERNGIAMNEPEGLHEHYAAFDAALASIPPES
jgi:hypothetical protein